MHKICTDQRNNLVIEFEPTNNIETDYFIEDYLNEAGFEKTENNYTFYNNDPVQLNKRINWVVRKFFETFGEENVDVCEPVKKSLHEIKNIENDFTNALSRGSQIKSQSEHNPNISESFKRQLKDYQKESVEHLIEIGNGANFSVPGSGKTTMTYASISRWLEDEIVEKIIVIGPTASFMPWEEEYEACFGKKARSCRIGGDLARELHNIGDSFDLFLCHFNTAMNRVWELQQFMQKWNTVLIIDESHYIKSPQLRRWASSALAIAPYAKRRIVLSGTPMPNNAKDLWTQITFLWPNNFPLGNQTIYNNYVGKKGIGKYKSVLDSLFTRIKKNDLNLPKPTWETIEVPLNTKQKEIYDVIEAKTLTELNQISITEQAKLQKFRIAKMVRLLQTASNPTLLYEMSEDYDLDNSTFSEEFGLPPQKIQLPTIDSTIIDKITNYSKHEVPSKMVKAAQKARELVEDGNKVIIWNSFIHNMSLFKTTLLSDLNPIVINGNTPKDLSEPENRDELISRFKNSNEPEILIASPASLGESVSLHKNAKEETVCNHAIYLDRNFNGAQYMQSMDRIHRIGMNSDAEVIYYLIIGKDTIDEVINRRLDEKWSDMLNALNDDMLESLDIDPEPEKLNPVEFNKDYQSVLDYLRSKHGN